MVWVSKYCPSFAMCLRIFEYCHEFPLYSITCEFWWAKSLNAVQILVRACWSSMCLPIFEYYHDNLPLHSIMCEFRWAKSLNAAQILLYTCESSMCLWIFKWHHAPLLHSIMHEFRWAKSLNAANNYGTSLQISLPVKLFSPTIYYPYSCTHRWRKCYWLIYGAVVVEITNITHICPSQCDPCLTKWGYAIDSLPVKLFSPAIYYPYSCTQRWRKCYCLIYGAVVVEITNITHICPSQCDLSLSAWSVPN